MVMCKRLVPPDDYLQEASPSIRVAEVVRGQNAQNDAFVAKIVNMRLTKGFMAIFAPAESLPSPATLFEPVITGKIRE